jgi:hypothetical protein
MPSSQAGLQLQRSLAIGSDVSKARPRSTCGYTAELEQGLADEVNGWYPLVVMRHRSGHAQLVPRPSHVTPLDARDHAILQEASTGFLAVDHREEVTRKSDGRTGRAVVSMLSGSHAAECVRTYHIRSSDGLTWTYAQPYSALAQIPGEHVFILSGNLPAPIQVIPAARQWRQLRFWILASIFTFFLMFFFGVGLLIPPLLLWIFKPWPTFVSPAPQLAKWLRAQPSVNAALRSVKFGWVSFGGSRSWKLPWVIQLHALGDGTSRLVVKAPDIGRASLASWRVGFLQAATIARAIQAVLPRDTMMAAQTPVSPTFS